MHLPKLRGHIFAQQAVVWVSLGVRGFERWVAHTKGKQEGAKRKYINACTLVALLLLDFWGHVGLRAY